ncbi:MAG: hypothetical protein U0172_10375 [Nitrospiraceae bacterium]
MWIHQVNALLGSLVVTVGLWIAAGGLPIELALLVLVGVAIGLAWISSHVLTIWAWTTALMGVESLAWPMVLMFQMKQALGPGVEPTDEQMQTMFGAILFGLFASIFWLTFSYGLFKWAARATAPASPENAGSGAKADATQPSSKASGSSSRKRKRK